MECGSERGKKRERNRETDSSERERERTWPIDHLEYIQQRNDTTTKEEHPATGELMNR